MNATLKLEKAKTAIREYEAIQDKYVALIQSNHSM